MAKMINIESMDEREFQARIEADAVFAKVLEVMEKNGVCYCRFTMDDGVQIIDPRYNQRITGVIADA